MNPVPSSKITPAAGTCEDRADQDDTDQDDLDKDGTDKAFTAEDHTRKGRPGKRSPTNKKPPTKTPTAKRSPKTVAPGSTRRRGCRWSRRGWPTADRRRRCATHRQQRKAPQDGGADLGQTHRRHPLPAGPGQDRQMGPVDRARHRRQCGQPGTGRTAAPEVRGRHRTALGGRREGCRGPAHQEPHFIPAAETQSGLLTQLGIGSSDSIIATLVDTVLSAVRATVITPRGLLSIGSSVLTSLAGGPKVISRAQWGADERIRCSRPRYSPQLGGAVVHHTAGSNDYTPQQSAEIVRGIYAYHAQVLNWCDIGYNVPSTSTGRSSKAPYGGLGRNVEGNHTGGFNRSTPDWR